MISLVTTIIVAQCVFDGGTVNSSQVITPLISYNVELVIDAPEVFYTGPIYGTGTNTKGAFQIAYNGSGTIGIECEGAGAFCYVPVLAHITTPALHGALTVLNATYMDGGLLLQLKNPKGGNGWEDTEFIVDAFGDFGNVDQQAKANFPPCPDTNAPINTFGKGAFGGALRYANDEERYYVCTSTGWHKMAIQEADGGFD